MPDLQNSVFISYRRKPASYIARAIFQDLKAHGYDVFMGVESSDQGEFGSVIQNQIKARPYFLLILTSGTVARFEEQKDWLRFEIEFAIAEKRKIIPLLIDEFKLNKGNSRYFDDKIAYVLNRQAVNVRHEHFAADMEKLRTRFLKPQALVATEPAPSAEKSEVERLIEEAATQPAPTKEELSAEAYLNHALARDEQDHEGQIADYTEAIRLNPHVAAAYYNRGLSLYQTGDYDGAIVDYSDALRIDPQYAMAYNNRAFVNYHRGNFDNAVADSNEALRLDLQSIEAYVTRGVTYFIQGKLDEALADFHEANKLHPDLENALAGLAITQFMLGKKDEAKQLWRSLLAKDQDYKDAGKVGKALEWRPELIEAARKLIAEL
ncbi:MAG: tetratricopeptide repeat protein [Chloroflexota bacterium]